MTISHEGHRARRKPLEPYFSRLGIAKLEPLLREHVERLHDRLNRYKDSGAVLRLDHIFTAFSGDVVHNTCCDDESRFLENPEFAPHLYVSFPREKKALRAELERYNMLHTFHRAFPLFIGFPVLIKYG